MTEADGVVTHGTRGRPRRYDTVAALEAALRLFWQEGYSNVSMAQIREATGMSNASLSNAFGTKQSLFEHVVDYYCATYGAVTKCAADETLPPRVALERALRQSLEMQTDSSHPLGCLVALSSRLSSEDGTGVRDIIAAQRQVTRNRIQSAIERGIDSGDLSDTTNVATLTTAIYAFLNGMSTEICDGTSADVLEHSIDVVMRMWDTAKE